MDEDDQYPESREELLDRFRNALGKPMSERFFDEDDLIEIFDFAGDIGDDYLRMEALMCGARFYPDSPELLERRGIFYSQYSESARSQFLSHRPAHSSMILDLIELRHDAAYDAESVKETKFDAVVDAYDKFSDEDVIQLMETVTELKMYDWFRDNVKKLRSKAEYLNGFLYEAAITAESFFDHNYAAALLEELTEAEPFNSYYWLLLSRQYANLEKFDKAIEAIDYSIAIKADSAMALLLKARYLYLAEADIDSVVSYAKKALELSQYALEPVRFLAIVYHHQKRDDLAVDLLEYVFSNPELGHGDTLTENGSEPVSNKTLELIPHMISFGAPNVDKLLDRFYSENPDNDQLMWSSWAHRLWVQGREDLAKQVSDCYERNAGSTLPTILTVEASFCTKRFGETIEKLNEYVKDLGASDESFPVVLAMRAISLVKLGEYKKALDICNFVEYNMDVSQYNSVTSRLEFIGLKTILSDLRRLIASGADPSMFDPFNYWK